MSQPPNPPKPPAPPERINYEVPKVINTKELNDDTISSLEHFGPNAAGLLNSYACALEDALIELVTQLRDVAQQRDILEAILAAHKAKLPSPAKKKDDKSK